jgi:histidinol-phosphate/aromatic aminotransferase/cobyric acid decarboxylase-like protein
MPATLKHPVPETLIRPLIRQFQPYVPGEQPQTPGLTKLNTNENPYPPAPKVLDAVRKASDQGLRLYPNPTAKLLREKLANLHGCGPENIIVGNGSDELLALATRAFVEPRPSGVPSISRRASHPRSTIQYFTPSYSLYPVLAEHSRRESQCSPARRPTSTCRTVISTATWARLGRLKRR